MKKAEEQKKGLTIEGLPGETEEQAIARFMLNPALQSAWTLKEYINSAVDLDLQALIDSLEEQHKNIGEDNLERIEEMLLSQAHTLDAIANNLFRRAKNQEYMSNMESYTKMGLRAQNQCRATLEALIRGRTPRTHLNQTNIAQVQQVNNEIAQSKLSSEKKLSSAEEMYGKRMDPKTPQEAVRGDQTLEAVGAKHWPKNAGRKG